MNTNLVPLAGPSTDPVCAYHTDCKCHQQVRHMFGHAHIGQNHSYPMALLTRDEIADRMTVLMDDKTVDRMFIRNTPDRCDFLWYTPNPADRVGNWVVDYEGHSYCFVWSDITETVHCATLGEGLGPIDCFGQRRWASHYDAVLWTLDNIQHIALPA